MFDTLSRVEASHIREFFKPAGLEVPQVFFFLPEVFMSGRLGRTRTFQAIACFW